MKVASLLKKLSSGLQGAAWGILAAILVATALAQQPTNPTSGTNAPASIGALKFGATSVNMNSANTDTPIQVPLPAGSKWVWNAARVFNCSTSMTTATVGVFTGPGGTGTAIMSAQAIAPITATAPNTASSLMVLAFAFGNFYSADSILYFRVVNAQGAASTCDVAFTIFPAS